MTTPDQPDYGNELAESEDRILAANLPLARYEHDFYPRHKGEKEPHLLRTRRFFGRAALAGVCMIPIADLALSDAASFKVLQVSQDLIEFDDSPKLERVVENGVVGLDILLESMLVGAAITRGRKLKGAFTDMEEYTEKRQATMSRPRKMVSKALNAPYDGLAYMSEKFESLGEKVARRKSPRA